MRAVLKTTLSHTHRFDDGGELKTIARHGDYERDQRASTIRRQPVNAENKTSCATPFVSGTSGASSSRFQQRD
jgi:hypothetical protein